MDKRRMCPNCRAFITTDDKVCPYCQFTVGPKAVERRNPADSLGGLIPHARFTTMLIMLINTGIYVAMVIHMQAGGQGASFDFDGRTLVDFGAKYGPFMMQGEWWRLVTAGFVHGGILHILMNMWVLFDLGAQTEESYGTSRYLGIYFVATVTGFLASFYWAPGVPSVGASAGICGLIGAMIALGVRDRSSWGAEIRRFYVRWVIYLLAFGILFPQTDNAAHIGGLAGGFAVGYIAGTPGYSQAVERIWQVLAGIACALTAFSFFKMFMALVATKGE
jgi:membrane associated rhomboid family serine protease